MHLPFRIGATSCIFMDDILPNVRQLAGQVEDIELVLFEVEEYGGNLPTRDAAAELGALAREHGFTYTVHLPLDLDFSAPHSFDLIARAIEATRVLDPFAYILHLDGRALEHSPSPTGVAQWQRDTAAALDRVLGWVEPTRLCIENLETWVPEHFADLVAARGVARCVDVGHYWKRAQDPLPHLREHLARTRVVHLHGVGERDHQSLARQPRVEVESVARVLMEHSFRGVVTLEVFSADDLQSSRAVLEEVLAPWVND